MALYKFSTDLSQNLKPEPSPIKTLSDIINGQAQQSLNRDVSIGTMPFISSWNFSENKENIKISESLAVKTTIL